MTPYIANVIDTDSALNARHGVLKNGSMPSMNGQRQVAISALLLAARSYVQREGDVVHLIARVGGFTNHLAKLGDIGIISIKSHDFRGREQRNAQQAGWKASDLRANLTGTILSVEGHL